MGIEHDRIADGPPVVIIIASDLLLRRILKRYCLRLDFHVITFVNPAGLQLTDSLPSKSIQYIISDVSFPLNNLGFQPDLDEQPKLITIQYRTQKRPQYTQNADAFLEIPLTLDDMKRVLLR